MKLKDDPIKYELWRKHNSESHLGHPVSKETRDKISKRHKGKTLSEEHKKKLSEAKKGERHPNFGKKLSMETCRKMGEGNRGKRLSESSRMKISEVQVGGFWYGNVKYYNKKKYCDLWRPEFRERVRAFFGYQCVECGTLQNGRKLGVHHVNYDKKACCREGEAINDRKFVALCSSCHSITNFNRESWEEHFNQIIDGFYQGKSYLTKDEIQSFKQNGNTYII